MDAGTLFETLVNNLIQFRVVLLLFSMVLGRERPPGDTL